MLAVPQWVTVRLAVLLGAAAAVSIVVAACAEEGREPEVLRVPQDHATIQRAVDRAEPGDLVLIDSGTYGESVVVSEPGITIRGVDRNAVVLDGAHELENGILVTADGVSVENLTVRNFVADGVAFDGTQGDRTPDADGAFGTEDASLVGFRVAYVTAANNGRYGVHALSSRDGLVEQVYASGHPGAGVAVSQCSPCNALVTATVAERNGIGFAGLNASGSLFVVDGVYRGNRLGVAIATAGSLLLAPQAGSVVGGNLVVDNDAPDAPASSLRVTGGGIVVVGGTENVVVRNRVSAHDVLGIGLVAVEQYMPIANRVELNTLSENAVDLYLEVTATTVGTFDNCFAGNSFSASIPEGVEGLLPCDAPAAPVVPSIIPQAEPAPDVDHRTIPAPPAQASMPGDVHEPSPSTAGMPDFPEVDALRTPPPA